MAKRRSAPSGDVAQFAVGASQQCVGQPVASKLHDKPKDSHDPGDLQAIGFHTNNLVQEVVKWQTDCATRCIPDRRSDDTEEAKLGERFKKLLLQRDKALGPEPSRRKLSLAEVALVNSVPGVPFRGCSVHGTTNCGIAQGGSGIATSGGPHLAACSQKEEDVLGSGDSSIEQPAVGAEAVMQSVRGSAGNTRRAFGQLPAKKARVAIEDCGSSISQSAAAKQLPSLAERVLSTESSSDLRRRSGVAGNKEDSRRTLLLQLKRPHYDAIKDRRKLWEARPLFDGSGRQTIHDKLAVVGNAAVLQSGAGTNDRVRIAEVRRYSPQGLSYPLQEMVVELGADLLPDVPDDRSRIKVYESLYGFERCARGFVAMYFEWPNGAAAASISDDSAVPATEDDSGLDVH